MYHRPRGSPWRSTREGALTAKRARPPREALTPERARPDGSAPAELAQPEQDMHRQCATVNRRLVPLPRRYIASVIFSSARRP